MLVEIIIIITIIILMAASQPRKDVGKDAEAAREEERPTDRAAVPSQ